MCPSKSIFMCIFYMIYVFKVIQPGAEFRSRAPNSQPCCPASRHPVPDPTWPWFLVAWVCYHSLWSVSPRGLGILEMRSGRISTGLTFTKECFQEELVLWDIPEKKKGASGYQIIRANNTYAPPCQMITIHIHVLKALRVLLVKKMNNSIF